MSPDKPLGDPRYADEKKRMVENLVWFNQFLRDSKELLSRMARLMRPEISGSSPYYYYPRSNSTPAIPNYFYTGMDGDGQTVHIYSILQANFLKRGLFEVEPSFAMVRIFQPGQKTQATVRGISVLSHNQGIQISQTSPHVSGQYGDGIRFQAFQVLLDPFLAIENADVDAVIRRELIERFKALPDLSA